MLHKNQILTITVYGKQVQVKQVNKTVAKRLYNAGHEIHLLPCRVNINTSWGLLYTTNAKECDNVPFDSMVNAYTNYNCNTQLGKYPHYYAATNLL